MGNKGKERSFRWTFIKNGAVKVALDYIFPKHQYIEQKKMNIEIN